MNRLKRLIRLSALAAGVAAAGLTAAQQQSEADRHMEATHLNTDGIPQMVFPWRAFYCNLADNNNQLVINERTKSSIRVPLTQIYDDVWYIGSEYVGQYLLRNANGFVMVDGGNNAAEMLSYNLPALNSLGLGSAGPLHGVLVTHGHFDHDGGALQMKTSTGAPIYLGSADAAGKAYAPVPLNSAATTPFDLTVGGRTFTVLPTPGHTAGATGFVVPARDGGKEVKLFVAGGSSLPSSISGMLNYLRSAERTYEMLKALKVDATSNPHISWDGSRDRIKQIQAEGLKSPSQFTIGNELLLRGFATVRECTATRIAQLDPSFSAPVWRVSKLEYLPASPATNRIAVKLSNGWGPMPGRTVTFTLEGRGATCTATTDAEGVATCGSRFGPFRPGVDKVTAMFEGDASPGIVDLGSERTGTVGAGCSEVAHAGVVPPGQSCRP